MSSDGLQPTLSGFASRQRQADASAWQPGDEQGACLSCGRAIPARIARVCGDNDGNVPACKRCAETLHGRAFESTVNVVRRVRGRREVRRR